MKIGIYSPYLETLGGGERYMLSIAEYLSREHSVDIFWNDKLLKNKVQKRLAIDISRTNIVYNIFTSKHIIHTIRKTAQYDYLFILSDGSIPFSLAKKTIVHFQRPFPNISPNNLLTKAKFAGDKIVICNSYFTKKWIDKSFKIESKVIYPPVSTEHFSPDSKENIVLSVGRFHEFKKHKTLVEVFQKHRSVFNNWKLIIAGGLMDQDNTYYESLKGSITSDNIELKPNISYDDLVALYSRAMIYWHAAGYDESERVNPEAMEHFGITTVEAMASGSVVVVYNGGGQAEIIQDGTNGFLWKTKSELVTKSKSIITGTINKESIIKHALTSSKKFSREEFNQHIEALLKP